MNHRNNRYEETYTEAELRTDRLFLGGIAILTAVAVFATELGFRGIAVILDLVAFSMAMTCLL